MAAVMIGGTATAGAAERPSAEPLNPAAPGDPPFTPVEPVLGPIPDEVVFDAEKEMPYSEPRPAIAIRSEGDHLIDLGRERFGDDYAGISTGEGRLRVHVRGTADALPGEVEGYEVVPATYTYEEMNRAKELLDKRSTELRDHQGVLLGAWRVDPATNTVRVGIVGSEGEAAKGRDVVSAFVGGEVAVSTYPMPQLPDLNQGRQDDIYGIGGARHGVYGMPNQACTTGFAWQNRYFNQYMIMAGHCFGWLPAGVPNGNDTNYLGTAVWWGKANGDDLAAHNGIVQGWIYVGGWISEGAVRVTHHYAGSQMGATGIRTSGQRSGEVMTHNGAVMYEGESINGGAYGTILNLTYGECWGLRGDSGGSTFVLAGGGHWIIAAGTHTGTPFQGATHCWYTPTSRILAHHGGYPITW